MILRINFPNRRSRASAGGPAARTSSILIAAALLLVVIVIGGIGALSLFETREARADAAAPVVEPPLVRVVEAQIRNASLTIRTEGVVTPGKESQLTAEVSGSITAVSPKLSAGGFFQLGESLLQIDTRDYDLGVARARAALEQAKLGLATEEQRAAVARKEWDLAGEGEPSALALHEPQLAIARAEVAQAQAALDQAQIEVERATVRAPFAGRVRETYVELGQYVQRGSPLASIYAADTAEVRLPIPDYELAFLSLPMAYSDMNDGMPAAGPAVRLRATFAGKEHSWEARVVRTDGEIDPRTGVVGAIAEVRNPYAQHGQRGRPPLAVGMFVEAEISGRSVRAIEVPGVAVRGDSTVLVIDGERRVEIRRIEVLRTEGESVLVRSGLSAGELVCLSPPELAISGMRVRIHEP